MKWALGMNKQIYSITHFVREEKANLFILDLCDINERLRVSVELDELAVELLFQNIPLEFTGDVGVLKERKRAEQLRKIPLVLVLCVPGNLRESFP